MVKMILTTILLPQGVTPQTDGLSQSPERRDRHSICGYARGFGSSFCFFLRKNIFFRRIFPFDMKVLMYSAIPMGCKRG